MARPKIRQAMRKKGYSYQVFADLIGTTKPTVCSWITGKTKYIYSHYVPIICDTLGLSLEDLEDEPLALIIDEDESYEESEVQDNQESEEPDLDTQRRQVIEALLSAAGITFLPGTATLSVPILIAPEESLAQCDTSIKASWALLQHKGFNEVQQVVHSHMLTLTPYATLPSEYREYAAGLACQAEIIQAILCTHQMDLSGREVACMAAVRFGKMTSDIRMRAIAMLYQAYTYLYCSPPQPGKAEKIFMDALALIGKSSLLLQSDAQIGLANAYAHEHKHDKAIETIAIAESLMPKHPEQDQSYLYSDHGWPEFRLWKSRAYLSLAQFSRDYFQQALDVFPSALESTSSRSLSEIALIQADAVRGLGRMKQFIELLEYGIQMAIQIRSQKCLQEATEIFYRIPEAWQEESRIQSLQKYLKSQTGTVIITQ